MSEAAPSRGAPEPPLDVAERVPAASFEAPTLTDRAVAAAIWAAGLGWLVPSLGALTAAYRLVPADRIDLLERLYCRGQIALTGCRWRAVVHPDVDPGVPYLFAQNHTNHFDHVMLYNATPHFKQGLERESHFRYPFYGWFMKARGTIPVRKGERGQTRDLERRFRREVERGHSILAFPEGTRTRTGRVGPFRRGIFYVAVTVGLPIVPVAVTGTFDMMRPGSWVVRPRQEITVYCERPIPTEGLTDADVPALAERVREVVARRVEGYWDERRTRSRG